MKSDFTVQNNVVNVCCSYLSMVFPYIGNVRYPYGRTYEQQRNVLNTSAERSQTAKIALLFTERPLTTIVTLFFRWKLREVSFRHE